MVAELVSVEGTKVVISMYTICTYETVRFFGSNIQIINFVVKLKMVPFEAITQSRIPSHYHLVTF